MFPTPSALGSIKSVAGASYDTSPVTKSFMTVTQYQPGQPYYTAWTDPDKASGASLVDYAYGEDSVDDMYFLKLTNAGFNLPPGATITNIAMKVRCYYVDVYGKGNTFDCAVAQIIKGGTPSGNSISPGTATPANSPGFQTVSANLATWGVSLSASDVNASDFGYYWKLTPSYYGVCNIYVYYCDCEVTFT